jgi:Zn-dependent peptidase ImmA (M78 family)
MSKAEIEASNLLEDLGFHDVPVIPEEICNAMSSSAYKITFEEKAMNSEEFHGMSLGSPRGAVILVNSNIKNRHRKRFTAAHEIGHVHLHVQTNEKSDFQCTAKDISSGTGSNNNFEKEANEFASSLLMPASIISPKIQKSDLSWALIEEIRKLCDVSLEAAARRVVALSKDACCLIIHKNNQMWTPVKSRSFKIFLPNQQYPKYLDTIPDNSESFLPSEVDECDFSDWNFPDKSSVGKLFYSSIHNDEFNRTMTLLLHDEDIEEEQDKYSLHF